MSALELRVHDPEGLNDRLAGVTNNSRKIPVPRRLLRYLARTKRRSTIATCLGHLFRCLYYRRGCCVSGGTCKPSWISEIFEVDVRTIKSARKKLIEDGWLVPRATSQNRLNRWGMPTLVNLTWSPRRAGHSCGSPPPREFSTTKTPPLYQDQELSSRDRSKNQKPAQRRPVGICKQTKTESRPSLRRLLPSDLRETQRLSLLYAEAVERQLISRTECDRLRFFGAAEHACAVGTSNPAGLFVYLVRNQRWNYITQRQEDAARQKLRVLDFADDVGRRGAAARAVRPPPTLATDRRRPHGNVVAGTVPGSLSGGPGILHRHRPRTSSAPWTTCCLTVEDRCRQSALAREKTVAPQPIAPAVSAVIAALAERCCVARTP